MHKVVLVKPFYLVDLDHFTLDDDSQAYLNDFIRWKLGAEVSSNNQFPFLNHDCIVAHLIWQSYCCYRTTILPAFLLV